MRSFAAALLVALASCAFASSALAESAPPSSVPAAIPAPSIASAAYVLLDYTSGQIVAAQNADEHRDPASLTKLMTAYLTFAALRDKTITGSQMVNVSPAAWKA